MSSTLAISSGTIAALVVIAVVDLFAIIFGLSFVRARRAGRTGVAAAGARGKFKRLISPGEL